MTTSISSIMRITEPLFTCNELESSVHYYFILYQLVKIDLLSYLAAILNTYLIRISIKSVELTIV